MSTNAFNGSVSSVSESSKFENLISGQNSFFDEELHSSETKLMIGGGILLALGLLFFIISHFTGSNMKANLTTENSVLQQIQQMEIVYKDQYGNILTEDQVKNVLMPSTPEVQRQNTVLSPEVSRDSFSEEIVAIENKNEVIYPKISDENVQVDTTKQILYVKESDAEKLIAENRLVRKVVDNRPLYVEPITGAVVELIHPIERPVAGQIAPPVAPPLPVVISSSETPRFTDTSSEEIGR